MDPTRRSRTTARGSFAALDRSKRMDCNETSFDEAFRLMKLHRYRDAIKILRPCSEAAAPDWNALYLLGQCYRFLNDVDSALPLLSKAAAAAPHQAPVYLALGIALQLKGRLDEACHTLFHAIEIDPDYPAAFNSLALTQKIGGEFEKALHNYDAGCKALARRIVRSFSNDPKNPIIKHRDTNGTIWLAHAHYGALWLWAAEPGSAGFAIPDGAHAVEEERTERHGGLYWRDVVDEKGETVRLFLPNYFNTFRETLRRDALYSNLIGNRGTVLQLLERESEARLHFDEAIEFSPIAV